MTASSGALGFGIIGCGTIAEVHANALAGLPGAHLLAVASRDAGKASRFAAARGCEARATVAQLFAIPALDVVSITSSSGSHAALTRAALEAGKHVMVEKPMAMTSAEARALVELARERKRVLAVISQRRFESHHLAVKHAVAGGALGRILLAQVACPYFREQAYYDSADWRGTVAEDGGALMNQSIHSVDLLLWLCGPAHSVLAETATQTHRMEAEDLALAIVRLASGGLATLMASTSIRPGFAPTLSLFGEHGSIKLAGPDILAWHVPGIEPPERPAESAVAVATHLLAGHDAHRAQFADLVAAIRTGRPPAVTGEDGFRAVALVEAVYQAAQRRASVEVARLT